MTLKQIFNIIIGLLLIFSIGSSIVLYKKNSKQETNIEYLRHNLIVKDSRISDMTYSVDELNNYIKFKDSKHKIEVDSILKSHNVKIKNLLKYQKINVQNIDTDTTVALPNGLIIKNDSIYKKNFIVLKKCVKIECYVLSKDSTTTAYITKVEGNNNIYITKSYVKTFWDKIFFRKGSEIIKTSSDCGDIKLDEINIKR